MTKHKPFSPKPVTEDALPPGAQNAGQAAHMRQQETNHKQVEMMKVGGGTTCPQVAMHGMQPTANDANSTSCSANGHHAQQHANAQYDTQVGKVASGGRRRRKSKRKSHKKRSLRKSSRSLRRSRNLKKRTTHKKKSRKHRK